MTNVPQTDAIPVLSSGSPFYTEVSCMLLCIPKSHEDTSKIDHLYVRNASGIDHFCEGWRNHGLHNKITQLENTFYRILEL